MGQLHLYVTSVPTGEAPAWVREKWVGLTLPLAQSSPAPRRVLTVGVSSDPLGVIALLAALLTGRLNKTEGYLVDAPAAIAILEAAHPEAAAWWKTHAPHFLRPRRKFVFHTDVGTVVATIVAARRATGSKPA